MVYINTGKSKDARGEGVLRQMLKDRALVRNIKNGNASDPGVKREAERIERDVHRQRVEKFREGQQKKLEQARIELKKSGGFAQ